MQQEYAQVGQGQESLSDEQLDRVLDRETFQKIVDQALERGDKAQDNKDGFEVIEEIHAEF